MPDWTVRELIHEYESGGLTRREFIRRLSSVGVSIGVISTILAGCVNAPAEGESRTSAPASGDEFAPSERGGGGPLRLLWWQAPSILNPHLTLGQKDLDASAIFYEQLAYHDADANLVPRLAAELPSRETGTLDMEHGWVVWRLKPGVVWHDGRPFTAEDVAFTWRYATDPATAALSQGFYDPIQAVEALDAHTVRVTYKTPTLDWSSPWNSPSGMILPKHIFELYIGSAARDAPANLRPVGTGAYRIVEFRPNDLVLAEINPNYHIENRPFFDRVEMKGGGDAAGAARAVLQTGEYDFAWNLQVDGPTLAAMERGGQGTIHTLQSGMIEHVELNYTDPNVEIDGERSSLKAPHPFFSDLRVRQAFALAMDRRTIVQQLYGRTGEVALFYLYAPEEYVPEGAAWERDLIRANELLDEAGWVRGAGGVRAKEGRRMQVLFQTSANKLRQDTQAIIKQDLEALGVEVELKAVIGDVFFAADPANPENNAHFYADMQMFTFLRSGPDDIATFLLTLLSTEVAQKSNNWSRRNITRYVSPEFDALYEAAARELDPIRFAEAVKRMNERIHDDIAVVPLVARADVVGVRNGLRDLQLSGWASNLWALPFWRREPDR